VMQALNKLGGKHGIGGWTWWRTATWDEIARGVRDAGGAILHFAHRQMETLTMDGR